MKKSEYRGNFWGWRGWRGVGARAPSAQELEGAPSAAALRGAALGGGPPGELPRYYVATAVRGRPPTVVAWLPQRAVECLPSSSATAYCSNSTIALWRSLD
jgi:hypothetical protein